MRISSGAWAWRSEEDTEWEEPFTSEGERGVSTHFFFSLTVVSCDAVWGRNGDGEQGTEGRRRRRDFPGVFVVGEERDREEGERERERGREGEEEQESDGAVSALFRPSAISTS
jgi:hypothetical protein